MQPEITGCRWSRRLAYGTWMVRVKHNKVSVGIFACSLYELPLLVDEACDPGACEFKPLPAGGFIFGGTVALHEVDERADHDLPHFSDGFLTEGWAGEAYEEAGDWRPIMIAHND